MNHNETFYVLKREFWAMKRFGRVKISKITSRMTVYLGEKLRVKCPKITPMAREPFIIHGACAESIWYPAFIAKPRAQAEKN